jgi:hypothetical protein
MGKFDGTHGGKGIDVGKPLGIGLLEVVDVGLVLVPVAEVGRVVGGGLTGGVVGVFATVGSGGVDGITVTVGGGAPASTWVSSTVLPMR